MPSLVVFGLILSGCLGNDPAPKGLDTRPITEQAAAVDAARDKLDAQRKAKEEADAKIAKQERAKTSRASAFVNEARRANTFNPDGNPKTAVDALTGEALKDLPPASAQDALAAQKIANLYLNGQLDEARTELTKIQSARDESNRIAAQAQLEKEKAVQAMSDARNELIQAKASFAAQVATIQKQADDNIAGARAQMQIGIDKAKADAALAIKTSGQKSLQRAFELVLYIAAGLAAIFWLLAYFGTDNPKLWGAGFLCTGIALFNGALAYFVGTEAFEWIAIIGGSILLIGLFVFVGFWLWYNRKEAAAVVAKSALDTLNGSKADAFDQIREGLDTIPDEVFDKTVKPALEQAMSPQAKLLVKSERVKAEARLSPSANVSSPVLSPAAAT